MCLLLFFPTSSSVSCNSCSDICRQNKPLRSVCIPACVIFLWLYRDEKLRIFCLIWGVSGFNLGRLRSVMSIFFQESLKMTLRVRGSKLEIWSCSSDLISSYGSKVIEFPMVAGELWVNFNYLRNLAQLALCISWIMMLSGLHRQIHASLLIPEGSGCCWWLLDLNVWRHLWAGDGRNPSPLFQWGIDCMNC